MIKLPSWHKTGFASNVNDLLSHGGIIMRPLEFATRGYSRSALRSLRSLRTSHSFGRPDLASELPLVPRVSADFLSPTKNRLVWGGSRQATIKSDLVGGKLNMFDFQTSRRTLSASVWWSPTIYREKISDSAAIFF